MTFCQFRLFILIIFYLIIWSYVILWFTKACFLFLLWQNLASMQIYCTDNLLIHFVVWKSKVLTFCLTSLFNLFLFYFNQQKKNKLIWKVWVNDDLLVICECSASVLFVFFFVLAHFLLIWVLVFGASKRLLFFTDIELEVDISLL